MVAPLLSGRHRLIAFVGLALATFRASLRQPDNLCLVFLLGLALGNELQDAFVNKLLNRRASSSYETGAELVFAKMLEPR